MAQFTIDIPQEKVTDLVDAFAIQYKYQESVEDPSNPDEMIPNPISKVQFAKDTIKAFVKETYVAGKLKAIETTRQEMVENAAADIEGVDVI